MIWTRIAECLWGFTDLVDDTASREYRQRVQEFKEELDRQLARKPKIVCGYPAGYVMPRTVTLAEALRIEEARRKKAGQ